MRFRDGISSDIWGGIVGLHEWGSSASGSKPRPCWNRIHRHGRPILRCGNVGMCFLCCFRAFRPSRENGFWGFALFGGVGHSQRLDMDDIPVQVDLAHEEVGKPAADIISTATSN
jgi:hypothetical protein